MFTLWPLTPLVIKWILGWAIFVTCQSVMESLHEAWRHHHVFTEAEDPLELMEAYIRFRGRKAETNVTGYLVLDCIWQSRNLMMVLEGNRTSLALQLSASAERLIHCRERQKETRGVTAQKGGRCPRTLLLARLVNDMWSHSHQNWGQMVKEGKIPTMNYKTDINRTLGCHEEQRKGENK